MEQEFDFESRIVSSEYSPADSDAEPSLRPKTLEEVSQEIRRTRERVRQIQNQALAKLRAMLADEAGFNNE